MKVRKCASCGAPLGEIAADATSVPCEFCGAIPPSRSRFRVFPE